MRHEGWLKGECGEGKGAEEGWRGRNGGVGGRRRGRRLSLAAQRVGCRVLWRMRVVLALPW